MLQVSAGLANTHVNDCVGAGTNEVSANAARVSGSGIAYVQQFFGSGTSVMIANVARVSGLS